MASSVGSRELVSNTILTNHINEFMSCSLPKYKDTSIRHSDYKEYYVGYDIQAIHFFFWENT